MLSTYLQTLLTGLDSGDVTSNTTTDDDQIVLSCCKSGEAGKVSDRQFPARADELPKLFHDSLSDNNSPASEA